MKVTFLFTILSLGIAQATSLPPAGDTYVVAQSGANFGAQASLNIGPGSLTLVQFDLTSLPAGTTAVQVTRANLRLYANRVTTAGKLDVALAYGPWTEAAVSGLNGPSAGSSVVSGVPVSEAGSYVTADVTSAVRAWLSGTNLNQGLIVSANTGLPATASFDSKENIITSHPPQLELELAVAPGPAGPQGPQGPAGPQGAIKVSSVCSALGYADVDPCLRAISPVKLVFLSAKRYTGLQNGVAGADTACQDEARNNGLTGTFKAWLTDSTSSPATRFSKIGHYRLTDAAHTLVAANFTELISSGPRVAITYGPLGTVVTGTPWIGDSSNTSPTLNCRNWTSNSGSDSGKAGTFGGPQLPLSCSQSAPVYCFQQ